MRLTFVPTKKSVGNALACALALAFAAPVAADVLHIPHTDSRPVLDDYINGVPANAGLAVTDLRQRRPGDGTPSSRKTTAYLSYDDKNFYAVFVCDDDPALVRAHMARRDDLIGDDAVELVLDTFHDKQRAFQFYVNPYGAQMDGKQTDGQDVDYNFDAQWYSDGHMTEHGWVAMMAIPFKSLRFKPDAKQTWGIAVGRVIARDGEFSFSPLISTSKEGFVTQLQDMEIGADIQPGRNIQYIPYVYPRRSRSLNTDNPNAPYWQTDNRVQAGVDVKFVLDNAFATDVTIKPDFSEIESDDPQVQINQRYQVQFPEKRPIFLENTGYFNMPQQLFYSRQIADPTYGARLTGYRDGSSVGALLIDDNAPGKLLATTDPDFGKTAYIGAFRLQKDTGAGSYIGGFVSDWELGGKKNMSASADARMRLDDNWVLTGQAAYSGYKNDGPSANGYLAAANLAREDRQFNYTGQLLDISPNFTANIGFIPRVDIRQTTQTAQYTWFDDDNDGKWVRSYGPKLTAIGTLNSKNKLQDWSSDAAFIVNGTHSATLQFDLLNGYELFDGSGFHKTAWSATATSYEFESFVPTLTIGEGDGVNYQPLPNQPTLMGRARNFSLDLLATPTSRFRLQQTWLWNDLRSRYAFNGQPAGSAVYRELLSRTKLNYQYNRFYAAHLIIDDNYLIPNAALNSSAKNRSINYDLLLSYTPTPGTAIYVGYSDLRSNMSLASRPTTLQITDGINMTTSRQVFMKCSYLF